MATKITSRKPLTGNLRSHALNATKTKRKLNKVTVTIDGKKYVTTAREARAMKKQA